MCSAMSLHTGGAYCCWRSILLIKKGGYFMNPTRNLQQVLLNQLEMPNPIQLEKFVTLSLKLKKSNYA
jgi:hypothetical protein